MGDTERLDFGAKPSIPAVRDTGGGLVVAPAEKASHLGSQFDSKQHVISSLSCFPQSMCNSLAFRALVLLRLLLDLDTYEVVDPLVCFLYFQRKLRISLFQI